MIYLFSKTECGPCILVKKYFKAMGDSRTDTIKEILLDDGCSEETLDFARKYSVTATPVLIIVDEETEELLETYSSGMPITQNIRKLWTKYGV